ncbi:MAG: hypothetical protein ACFFD4_02210 [Candidatus Odinarchaeota archaeon]
MPKHSRYRSSLTCKVNVSGRRDGQNRYRISLPKVIGDSAEKIEGVFEYDPVNRTIVFGTRPSVDIP